MTAVERPTETVAAPEASPQRLRMTYEEYLAWASEDIRTEWVKGEVIIHLPPKPRHQDMLRFLGNLLDLFVNLFKLGKVLYSPVEMRLQAQGSSREPDLLFVANTHLERLTEDRLEGPADLVIEIISDDSVTRDRVDKFDEYEAACIPEYWIIDPRPTRQRANFYQLDERGHYQAAPIGADGLYHSKVLPGFWLRVEWLWAEALPAPLSVLGQIVGPQKVVEALGHSSGQS
jgi:Uma2 family endonuclease